MKLAPVLFVLLCIAVPVLAQTSPPAAQQKFFGRWKLDTALSKIAHPGDSGSILWRSYAADGDQVKVAWGNVEGEAGSYSARCDGSLEPSNVGKIRCHQAGSNQIDGEQLDSNDPLHRYYRRMLSSRGKIMSIIWYTDEKRRHALDRFVYTRN
jgi:hypothetical protein